MKLRLFLLLCLQFLCGCSVIYYDGDYHGKVIDADTREPIEGAVVLGEWDKAYPTPGGQIHSYYDARETVTDKNGEFTIKGMGLRVMTFLEKMSVIIFKAGYQKIGLAYYWEDLAQRDYVKWEGKKAIIPLKKLSIEERLERTIWYETGVPDEKQKKLIEEIKKERNETDKL